MLDQILNLIDLVWPFVLSIAPVVAVIARKINKAGKETADVAIAVTGVVKEAMDVISQIPEIIRVKDDGTPDFDPDAAKQLPKEIAEVRASIDKLEEEIPEMVSSWKDVFKRG